MRAKEISFLHFSDLHMGLNAQMTLLSQFKEKLFKDIEKIYSYTGGWDLVFFTGDFVQSGKIKEYEQITLFLNDLWDLFDRLGCNPLFLSVPGNHDLEREPNKFNTTLKYLLNWGDEKEFAESYFWDNATNECKSFIDERFKNYTDWYQQLTIPKPESKVIQGYLPGDFACILNIRDIKIGCIGLNSSFLQLNGDDFKGRLEIHDKQIFSMLNTKYVDWIKNVDIPILMTHHSTDWLTENSRANFYKEIYFPESYLIHLCGHMHDPSIFQSNSIISTPQKTQVAPSLFGLETTSNGIERIHGYYSGKIEITQSHINQHLYPRIKVEAKDGSYIIAADNTFNLVDEKFITFTLKKYAEENKGNDKNCNSIIREEERDIFSLSPNKINESLSRTSYTTHLSHYTIRKEEREKIITELKNNQLAWLVASWGLGEKQFIGSILVESEINELNCISVDCSDVINTEKLKERIENIFQLSFNNFVSIISQLSNSLLVLDRVNPGLHKDQQEYYSLMRIMKSITDFAPNLKIIILTEDVPEHKQCIELTPLDIPSVKLYASAYNVNDIELNNPIAIEKLHKLTSGLPVYLDKHLSELKYCSLTNIINREVEDTQQIDSESSLLFKTIQKLKKSENTEEQRSFKLLTILSLLEAGEIFDRITRFNTTKPFYIKDVTILEELSLLEVASITEITYSTANETETKKLLRIKRPARDYINQIIDEQDKIDIYKNACELYFGENWRYSGKFKLHKSSTMELNPIIFGNSFVTIKYLLQNAIKKSNQLDMERYAKLNIIFCETLSNMNMYKDCVTYTEICYNILKNTELERYKVYIGKIYGETLRMNDSLESKSVDILNETLKNGETILSKRDKASINLDLAYHYVKKGYEYRNEAIDFAKIIKKISDKDDSSYLAAESIIARYDDKEIAIKKLRNIANKAKKHGYQTTQENVLLTIATLLDDPKEKLVQIENSLKCTSSNTPQTAYDYNKVRAIIQKAEIYSQYNKIQDLLTSDLHLLDIAYTYLFYQNLPSLFDRCHKVIWEYLIFNKDYVKLLNLFRHSSFVWRIIGKDDKEILYINDLVRKFSTEITLLKTENYIENINKTYYSQRLDAIS